MDQDELKNRTKSFGLRVLSLIDTLPKSVKGRVVANQLARSGTSVGANYRAACRARSKAEFSAKIGTVTEEADESAFWLEITIESNMLKGALVKPLLDEAYELVAIMTKSRKTVDRNRRSPQGKKTP